MSTISGEGQRIKNSDIFIIFFEVPPKILRVKESELGREVEMNENTNSPIIIIGMHRSGTSVLALVLESLGLFIGKSKDENQEAIFFRALDDWMIKQSGGSWEYPEPAKFYSKSTLEKELVMDYINHVLKTPRIINYLGLINYFKYRRLENLSVPWGWKSPRSTYTLPIWLYIFPNAKVIHVIRHGVDVANSLKTRREKFIERSKNQHDRRKQYLLYFLFRKRGGFGGTMRCSTLEGAFSLWEEYVVTARNHMKLLKNRGMTINYEDLLINPEKSLSKISSFCELGSIDNLTLTKVSNMLNSNRAYAYKNHKELYDFAIKVEGRLKEFGYYSA